MKKTDLFALSMSLCLLSGCSTIVNGTHQSISVSTPPFKQAHCLLENDKGKWDVNQTPGNILVHRSVKNLQISCSKAGLISNTVSVKSILKPTVFGNILFGGVIGAGVDVASGSAYEYPSEIIIPLKAKTDK